jgi:hypothetical protein
MGEDDCDHAWDEYQWERFLQQQDRKTEKYMELLEKYMDDPQRDEIVAREMGWGLPGEENDDDDDWNEEADALLSDAEEEETRAPGEVISECAETFEQNALYRASFNLTIWLDQLFEAHERLPNDPAAVKLATHAALAAAKLAAALSDEEGEELGMTIAYLKRALKAITLAMEAAGQLLAEKSITRAEHSTLQQRLFQVRDGIITLMGEFRGDWLRRNATDGFGC